MANIQAAIPSFKCPFTNELNTMDLPVRLGWLPDEAVVLPGQFPAASDGGSNELIIGPVLQGTCTGLRVRCSARTAEVFSAAGGGIANSFYECTLRGIAAESEKDIFALEYKLRGGIRPGSIITFKLLSLIDKLTIKIESFELLEESTQDQDHHTTDTDTPRLAVSSLPSHQISNFSSSQMDGIRDLLAHLSVEPTDDDPSPATADPKRALMAAISKSALNTESNQIKNSKGGNWGGGGNNNNFGSDLLRNTTEGADAYVSLIPQIFTLLQQQQQEICELKTSFKRIEALCLTTQNLIAAGRGVVPSAVNPSF